MSFLSSKSDRDAKVAVMPDKAPAAARPAPRSPAQLSIIGAGMQVTGNIVCTDALQISGRVTGDIHAGHLTITEGAKVEGKVVAPEAIVQGTFNGTIQGNIVRLEKNAVVEGEIFNKSLSIGEAVRFEGVSRRLDRAVEGPVNGEASRDDAALRMSAPPLAANQS